MLVYKKSQIKKNHLYHMKKQRWFEGYYFEIIKVNRKSITLKNIKNGAVVSFEYNLFFNHAKNNCTFIGHKKDLLEYYL